ncbi:MAG: 2-phospho-L-lactate guanylyltransferase [Solirubrobacterales bacterium]|nr:2-phospho-L-lactate guanylyltransferase [Solirubrobacterales bacterium]
MRTLAVLPIKNLDQAKQRLRAELEPTTRRSLAESMFSDVLVALRRTERIDQVIVVSSDNVAQRIAGGYQAHVVTDADTGHNDAAARGVAQALELGADRVLMVPADCPLMSPIELDELLARPVHSPSVLIVPDRHGTGTNALLLTPPEAMAPSFGPGSHERHLREGAAAGIEARTAEVPTLALDVDTLDDLAAVQETLERTRGNAAHTRGMLRQLLRSRT